MSLSINVSLFLIVMTGFSVSCVNSSVSDDKTGRSDILSDTELRENVVRLAENEIQKSDPSYLRSKYTVSAQFCSDISDSGLLRYNKNNKFINSITEKFSGSFYQISFVPISETKNRLGGEIYVFIDANTFDIVDTYFVI